MLYGYYKFGDGGEGDRDRISAGPGDDFVFGGTGTRDEMACGGGTDEVLVDADFQSGVADDCETVKPLGSE